MYTLKWDRAGASPLVRWALMQPLGDDPAFFQLWRVFESFWRLSRQFAFLREAWTATVFTAKFAVGFLHAFHMALAAVDRVLDERWMLSGSWFTISWDSLAIEDLKQMLAESWQQTICARLGHRKDYAGLQTIDVQVSFGSVRSPDKSTTELIATIQDGTFCTNHVFSKYDPDKAVSIADDWMTFSTAVFTVLSLLRFDSNMPKQFWNGRKPIEPRSKTKALAAWAVVEMASNQILSRGLVPGLTQSSDLAELCAAYSVLLWALRFGVSICIHSDSAYMADGLRVLRHLQAVPRKWKHQRFWKLVHDVLIQLDLTQWDVHKLYSHRDVVQAVSPLEEWWILGNAKADAAAAEAFESTSSAFRQTYTSLCEHHDFQVKRVQRQLAFLVDVAKFELEHRQSDVFGDEDITVGSLLVPRFPCTRGIVDQVELDVLEQLSDQHVFPFPVQFGKALLSYLFDLDMTASCARVVTGIELMAGFLAEGNQIPLQRFVDGKLIYEDPSAVCCGGLIRNTIATALKTFKVALAKFLSAAGVQFDFQQSSRPDIGLCVRHWSILIGWPDQCEAVVSKMVQGWFATRRYRKACDLARPLPG
eukprot:s1296_g1.t1